MVSPPARQAATLSGWPSSVAASWKTASSESAAPSGRRRIARGHRLTGPARARAASRPQQIAAADEPSPRPCGIAFTQRRAIPGGCPPIAPKAARMARTTRCCSPAAAVSLPSPDTSMASPPSVTRASTSS